MIDTGADCSCFPPALLNGAPVVKMEDSVRIFGFHASSEPHIVDEMVPLELNFEPGKINANFMVCETANNIPIIGADILRSNVGISIDTSSDLLTVKHDVIHVKPSIRSSKKEYLRRKRMGVDEYRRQNACLDGRERWMRVSQRIVLPPHSMTYVECEIDGARMPDNVFSLLSLYDNNEDNDIICASLTFSQAQRNYVIPVENRSDKKIVLWKRFALGEVKEHNLPTPSDSSSFSFTESLITLADLRENFEGFDFCGEGKETEAQCDFETARLKSEKTQNFQNFENRVNSNTPVPLSTLQGQNKPSEQLMKQFYENGVLMDIPVEVNVPKIDMDQPEIDIEAEKQKSKDCPFWTDKEEYLKGFDLSEFNEQELPYVKSLLWDFKHTFMNNDTPQMFRQPINIKPIKIETLPGIRPRKDKRRIMSAEKEALLKIHIDRLVAEGVVEELKNVEDCHASNIVVVIEQRYHCTLKKKIQRVRITCDMRSLNLAIPSSSYPIPDMEQFRRDLTQSGFKYFTNLDCHQYYHQIPIQNECGKKLFGFYGLNRIYYYKRLPQGLKSSPPISQAVIDTAYSLHPHAKAFLDDVTTYSRTREEMLYTDLPLTLAIASYYRILFKREKADLMKSSARVLGHQISEGSHQGITQEKIDKINTLTFPKDKKELGARLAFMNWFNHTCPRLSEILSPLRRYTKKHVKYKPTETDEKAFENARQYLLHPAFGALRTPSTDLNHPICIFTDASATSYSAVLTQLLPRTSKDQSNSNTIEDPDDMRLYIIGCWSGVVSDTMLNFPIHLKELFALAQTFVKYKWLLSFRETIVCTDSQTIQWWTNLGQVSDDVARRLIYIQKFNYKLIYISTLCNPADTFTRLCPTQRQGVYERFAHDRVFNANGEKIDPAQLFSAEKQAANEAFFKQRRQALSNPVDRVDEIVDPQTSDSNDTSDNEDSFIVSQSSISHAKSSEKALMQTTLIGQSVVNIADELKQTLNTCKAKILNGTQKRRHRDCRRRRRRELKMLQAPQNAGDSPSSPSVSNQDVNSIYTCKLCTFCIPLFTQYAEAHVNEHEHCTCLCSRNEELNREINSLSNATIEIDDNDFEDGREQVENDVISDDVITTLQSPMFDDATLKTILDMQDKDQDLIECRRFLEGAPLPNKNEAILLPSFIQDFLRNFSSFQLSPQKVITRIWLEPNGEARHLLVLGNDAFMDLLRSTHEFNPDNKNDSFAHLGIRKTRKILGENFYVFKMHKKIASYISSCPVCRLNNDPITHKDPLGEQISPESGYLLVIDYVGPLGGWATSNSGQRRYIFLGIDASSRYVYTCVTSSTSDEETLRCILEIRSKTSSLYKKYQMDNAICNKRSKTRQFLEQNGISISHGLPYHSLSQSKAERAIRSIMRLINKLHTAQPTTSFQSLVSESTIIYNSAPHDSTYKNMAPRDLHFARPASTFLNVDSAPISGLSARSTISDALKAARASGMESLKNDVVQFLKRQPYRSPRNLTAQLQLGDLVLKKKSIFLPSAPKKLQFKIAIQAFEVIGKLASNAFKVKDLKSGEISLLSGDVLIRVRGHTKASLLRLVQAMEDTAQLNQARADGAVTRSRTARDALIKLSDKSLRSLRKFWRWSS